MATNYPGALDSLTNPSAGDALTSPSHSAQHANANDAIEAIETELGTTPSGSESTVAARLDKIEDGTRLAANSVGATQLADSAVDTAAIQDGAVTAAKLARQPGNLLTENQASVEDGTTGWSGYNTTVARSTAQALHGSASLLVTATTTGGGSAFTPQGTSGIPVVVGQTYTATASFRAATNTPQARIAIAWFDSGGSYVGTVQTTSYVATSSSWNTHTLTAVAPAGAVTANFEVQMAGGAVGDAYYADALGFWRGAAGVWSLPGVPVTGQSEIATNGAVHLSGTGTPEGVITAAPGSTWLQTDSTTDVKGWLRWIKATGTGNTGWVAGPEADTGMRDVSASLLNGWTGTLTIQRVGKTVYLYGKGLSKTSATSDAVYSLLAGFRSEPQDDIVTTTGIDSGTDGAVGVYISASTAIGIRRSTLSGNARFTMIWTTTDPWPSSLPGSAA